MKGFQADNELIEKLRDGDIEAFDLVYKRYAGNLYTFSLKYLKSKEEAEELDKKARHNSKCQTDSIANSDVIVSLIEDLKVQINQQQFS